MSTHSNPIVTLDLPKRYDARLALAKAILLAFSTNKATFPSPTPALAQFSADVSAFDAAQQATSTKTKGTVATRDEKCAIVITDLKQLKGYVQLVADASPEHAVNIAQSAGMSVRKPTSRTKTALTTKPATVSGAVKVIAKAIPGAKSYEWQYSTDNKTWLAAPPTTQSKAVITGLTAAVLTYFRHRPITKTGPGEWSQVVSAIVT